MADLTFQIQQAIRDVKDYPKPGILFKDLTPILKDPELCKAITQHMADTWKSVDIQAVAGLDARGFWFGPSLAMALNLPFIPIRKAGKLPYDTIQQSYALEYGTATVEMHTDAVEPGWKVLVHDDLLATGGTAAAAAQLLAKKGAAVAGFAFLVNLSFLDGVSVLKEFNAEIHSLVTY